MPVVVVRWRNRVGLGNAGERRVPAKAGSSITIGRGENNVVQLSFDTVSRHHAAIDLRARAMILHDTKSTSGTYLNGAQIRRPTLIRSTDRIEIGWLRLEPELELTPEELSTECPETRFLEAIRDAPDDDSNRIVYADWLEERNEKLRAECIRLSLERRRDDRWSAVLEMLQDEPWCVAVTGP